jgi:hypothetical protein
MQEGNLHKWFKGSKSKDGKSGWVNVVTGGTCASDKPGEGTPKCVSSSKRASMTPAERKSAQRRKKAADPNQQSKSGAAKPTYVSTDKPKKKMKEEMEINEADKKGKSSGKKDACYHKVKASASVWPSAYASGRLVQCRKKGAANYGKSKKNEEFMALPEFTDLQIRCMKAAGVEVEVLDEKCWVGYTQKGMKKKGKKVVPNCVPVGEGYALGDVDQKVGAVTAIPIVEKKNRSIVFDSRITEIGGGAERLDEISKKLARSYVDKATVDRDKNAKDWMSTGSGEAFNKAENREKNIQRATSKLYKGTPAGKIMGTKNPAKVSATGKDPAEPKEKSKGIKGLVKKLTRKEEFVNEGLKKARKNVGADTCWDGYKAKGTKKKEEVEIEEATRVPAQNGNVYLVGFTWRGKYMMMKLFFPEVKRPSRKEVTSALEKIYPGCYLQRFDLAPYNPSEPMINVGVSEEVEELEEKSAAWQRKEGKNKEGGLNEKGRKSYERENPGSDLKAPQPEGGPRKRSFCARMGGMKGPMKKPNGEPTRKALALRKWKC